MHIACLDLEGVLVPEIWLRLAARTGIAELRRTTRDEPNYEKLMRERLAVLARNGLGLPDIEAAVAELAPLPGAREFLDALRAEVQVVILSDTFYPFAKPLMAKLGWPALWCHDLEAAEGGALRGIKLRQPDAKRRAVSALRGLNFRTLAAGDSYNDTAMLGAADFGVLFRPPDNVAAEFPQLPVARDYAELRAAFNGAMEGA